MKRNKVLSLIGLIGAASLALTGCTADGGVSGGNEMTSAFANDGCTHITVATSSEKVNLMEELAKEFKESPEAKGLDKCVTVLPLNAASGDAARYLSASDAEWPKEAEEMWPTLWSPASTVWTERVKAAASNPNLVGKPESFAYTPVVFGMPESMAKVLGYPDKDISMIQIKDMITDPAGWESVGKPLWGDFKISKTNPNSSTTGLSTILMQSYAAAGKQKDLTVDDVKAAASFSEAFELGAIHYGDTTGKVLTTLANSSSGSGSGYVSAIAVEETSLLNYNQGNPDSHTLQPGEALTPPSEKLVAIYPQEGSLISDNPVTVLNAKWVTPEKKAAGEAFAKFLHSEKAQTIVPKYGFRPNSDKAPLGDLFTAKYGVDPAKPANILPLPGPSVVSAALDQWEQIRKPSAVLELIDISGSMDESAGDGRTRLEGAIQGVKSTVGNFRSTDNIGVWAFTTGIKSSVGENIVPVREFGPLNSDKENLQQSVEELSQATKGGTPLYDSIAVSYDYMLKHAESGRINAIIVLSDGEDTDSRTSLDSLLVKINQDKEGVNKAPVRIFTIAYGQSADKNILERIAKASGGQMFDASDSTRIDEVFQSVVNNF